MTHIEGTTFASGDFEGVVKLWTVESGNFEHKDSIQLPSSAGAVLLVDGARGQSEEVYILSGYDQIFRWFLPNPPSVTQVVEGFPKGFTSLMTHTMEDSFFVTTKENTVLRFHPLNGLEWRSDLMSLGMSISCHSSGKVIAVGCSTGDLNILSTMDGAHISMLPVADSDDALICLSYSASGENLAIGTASGCLYLLPVSDDGLGYHKLNLLKVCYIGRIYSHSSLSFSWNNFLGLFLFLRSNTFLPYFLVLCLTPGHLSHTQSSMVNGWQLYLNKRREQRDSRTYSL